MTNMKENEPDFSHLPDVAWVKVMTYLPITDRYYLSQTCHALSDTFSHPSLWHTIEIRLVGSQSNYVLQNVIIPRRYYQMIQKFGHCFQNLTLIITGHFCVFPDEWKDIFHQLGHRCHLESLTLQVGQLTSLYHLSGFEPFKQDVKAVLSVIEMAFRLKKFHLKSWPMFASTFNISEQNVFSVLMENKKLRDLECLTLFWAKETEWTERQPILPSPDYTLDIVNHFKYLTQLGLRSPMLSDDIIQELSSPGRAKLQNLQIFVNYSRYLPDYKIPKISSGSWIKLVQHNPKIEVELTLMSRVPAFDLAFLLKPELPLSVINIMKYAHCDGSFLESLKTKYSSTLKHFVCYCDALKNDRELLELVSKCVKIKHFIYHGCINYMTVVQLAEVRGKDWQKFEVAGQTISTENIVTEFTDEDEVISEGEDGQYYLVSMMKMQRYGEGKEIKLSNMITDVSQYLGYHWTPYRD